jgi:hypothetical protein
MYTGLQVNILMKIDFSGQIFEKYWNIKFHENPSSGSRVFPCKQTHRQTDEKTDMTKLIVAFRNFANVPKIFKPRSRSKGEDLSTGFPE